MKQNSMHFFVAISTLSLFILRLFFLEREKKKGRESNGDKKNAGSSVSSPKNFRLEINVFSKKECFRTQNVSSTNKTDVLNIKY